MVWRDRGWREKTGERGRDRKGAAEKQRENADENRSGRETDGELEKHFCRRDFQMQRQMK